MLAAWLLCIARAVSAISRLSLGPLLPLLVLDLEFTLHERGQLLASFSQGYLFTQVVGGVLADRVGAKAVVVGSLFITGVGLLIAPIFAAQLGARGLILTYFVIGVVNGPLFPCCSVMLRDVPPGDRSQAMAIVDAGGTIGGCLATALCPVVATLIGWQALLRSLAVVAVSTSLLFAIKAVNPAPVAAGSKQEATRGNPLHLFCFVGPWALFWSHAVFNYANYFLNAWLPSMYVERFSGMTAAAAGGYLMWPELAGVATRMVFAAVADKFLLKSGRMSLLGLRRSASALAFFLQGVALMFAVRSADPLFCTAWLTVAAAVSGFHACGLKANYLDLTRAHSGILAGVGNTLASLGSAAGPVITSSVLASYPGAWEALFSGIFALNLAGTAVAGLLLSVNNLDECIAPQVSGKKDD